MIRDSHLKLKPICSALLNCESEIIREPYSVAEVQHCNNPADITYQCKHTDLLYSLQPPVHACPLPQSYVTQPILRPKYSVATDVTKVG